VFLRNFLGSLEIRNEYISLMILIKKKKKNRGELFSQPQYAQIIGSSLPVMVLFRPGVVYVVRRLRRYT